MPMLTVRVTEAERDFINEAAKVSGVSQNTFCRARIVADAESVLNRKLTGGLNGEPEQNVAAEVGGAAGLSGPT